jgi:hypothetical protein
MFNDPSDTLKALLQFMNGETSDALLFQPITSEPGTMRFDRAAVEDMRKQFETVAPRGENSAATGNATRDTAVKAVRRGYPR